MKKAILVVVVLGAALTAYFVLRPGASRFEYDGPPLEPGDTVARLSGKTAEGNSISVDFTDSAAVIYVTNVGQEGTPGELNLRQIAASSPQVRFYRILVDGDALSPSARSVKNIVPVFALPPQTLAHLRPSQLPLTAVIGTGGRVEKVWFGPIIGNVADEVASHFMVSVTPAPLTVSYCPHPADDRKFSPGSTASIEGQRRTCGTDGGWR